MDDVLVVHRQQDVVRDRQIGIVVAVGHIPLDDLADGNLLAVEQQDALLPVHPNGAVRFVDPGGIDDHEVVRLLGEGLGIIQEFAHSHDDKVSVARYAFFVPIPPYSGRPQLFLISLITKELWTEPRLSMVPRVLMRKLL